MKIGIISDIHSNYVALITVLEKFEKNNVEKIVCCGDMIGIGPSPEEVVQKLIKNEDLFIAIRGNHEQYLINGLPKQVHDDKRKLSLEEIQNHEWMHKQLSETSKNFLLNLPLIKDIIIENKRIHIIHYPMNENRTYRKHVKNPDYNEIEEMFPNEDYDIFLYGHTHTASVNCVNGRWYINPGSVGCPMLDNYANCGILTIDKEKIGFEQLKIKYDVRKVIEEIKLKKYPDYEGIIDIFFGGRKK